VPQLHSVGRARRIVFAGKMLNCMVSTFDDPEKFLAALWVAGRKGLLIVEAGEFQAQLITAGLRDIRLTYAKEGRSRITEISLHPGTIRLLLPPVKGHLVSGGAAAESGLIVSHTGSGILHERLNGPGEWRELIITARHLRSYSRVLTGDGIVVPTGVREWRPPKQALSRLVALHVTVTKPTGAGPSWH
jgi:hypothetical protein